MSMKASYGQSEPWPELRVRIPALPSNAFVLAAIYGDEHEK
jgi:hypothetical protein